MTGPAPPPPWIRTAVGAQATLLVGMGLGRFSYTPMVPALIEAGALSAAEAGLVGAANLGGYLVGGLALPWLLARAEARTILRASLVVAFVALAASAVPAGFAWLLAWRGLLGVTVAVMMILAIASVTAIAPARRLGRATGIAFTGVGLGIFFAAAGLPFLLEHGLAWAWLGTAGIGLLGLAAGLWGWSGPAVAAAPARAGPPPRLGPHARRLVAAQGLFSIGLVPHSIYWVDYLVRGLGWSMAEGGAQWTLFGLGAVAGTVAWGWLADRFGFSAVLTLVFASLAAGLALPVLAPGALAVVLSSLVVGAQPGLSAVIAGRAQQAIGAGSMLGLWRWMVLAVGIGQLVGGYGLVALFNSRGSYTEVFLVGAAAMAGGAILAFGLRSGDRDPAAPH